MEAEEGEMAAMFTLDDGLPMGMAVGVAGMFAVRLVLSSLSIWKA